MTCANETLLRLRRLMLLVLLLGHATIGCSKNEDRRMNPGGTVASANAMILIPAGWFTAGTARQYWAPSDSDHMRAEFYVERNAPRRAWVASFSVDRLPATKADYLQCVTAGGCTIPPRPPVWAATWYAGNQRMLETVDFPGAVAYCAWRGKRLLTAMEWEKAARGDKDARIYPWGDRRPTCAQVKQIYHKCLNKAAPLYDNHQVGEYPTNKSDRGVQEMINNAGEFTSSLGSNHMSEGKMSFTSEQFNGETILALDWSSTRFNFLPEDVLSSAPPTQQLKGITNEELLLLWGPVVKGVYWGQLDQHAGIAATTEAGKDSYAAIRCARDEPGPPPPKIVLPPTEFTYPYREPDAGPGDVSTTVDSTRATP